MGFISRWLGFEAPREPATVEEKFWALVEARTPGALGGRPPGVLNPGLH